MQIAIVFALIPTVLFYLLYQWKKHTPQEVLSLIFKGAATLCCAGLAVYGACMNPNAARWLLAAGLLVCTVADVLLRLRFLAGMACFAAGHVCYCIAFFLFALPTLPSLIVFAAIEAAALSLIPWAQKKAGQQSLLPFIAYGTVLSSMLAFAVAQQPLLLSGAVLFVISDWMLGYQIATKNNSRSYDYICLGCYYLAQFLIAASTCVIG